MGNPPIINQGVKALVKVVSIWVTYSFKLDRAVLAELLVVPANLPAHDTGLSFETLGR